MSTRSRTIGSTLPLPALRRRDLVCFSHLRWDFVFQRPQHLLTRAARDRRVFYVEEPVYDGRDPRLESRGDDSGVVVVIPHLPRQASSTELRTLLEFFFSAQHIDDFVAWYYTPMALDFTAHLCPAVTVYDCMDELSGFAGAPPTLRQAERALMARADLVFTGGHSLYLAKRDLHRSVHEFPSGVDIAHFAAARLEQDEPGDQARIPSPRIGFFGVLDERLDRALLAGIAREAPGWQFIMIGPVTKIDRTELPVAPNLHYLGAKNYTSLPSYIAGWDVAMLPFARNDATRYISPTKTPEYLAAGRPVVSTSIIDVVRPYGDLGLARIADTPREFVQAIRDALSEQPAERLARADAVLADKSWDAIWLHMSSLVHEALERYDERTPPPRGLTSRTSAREARPNILREPS